MGLVIAGGTGTVGSTKTHPYHAQNGVAAPIPVQQFNTTGGALGNGFFKGCRVTVPYAGTLKDFSVWIGTSSGNIRASIWDTGDALAGSRTRLWDSGSVAAGTGSAWQTIGDPALVVTAGQQLDFSVCADNGTLTLGNYVSTQNTALPTSFWPATGGALPKMAWSFSGTFASPPTTIAEASVGAASTIYFAMCRII